MSMIRIGMPRYDTDGRVVNAHGVGVQFTTGDYRLRITVTGERPAWFTKAGTRFGPTDSFVHVEAITVT